MKTAAFIPARSGSKGLPNKNIKMIAGKPLIAWSIEQAKASKLVEKVFVSTDCPEIAELSKYYGATVPFLRPKNLFRLQRSHHSAKKQGGGGGFSGYSATCYFEPKKQGGGIFEGAGLTVIHSNSNKDTLWASHQGRR